MNKESTHQLVQLLKVWLDQLQHVHNFCLLSRLRHKLDTLQTDQNASFNWHDLLDGILRMLSVQGKYGQQMLHLSAFYTLHAQPERSVSCLAAALSGCACSV